ncbi:recombinase family protein [Methylocystis silviterrae]|uniref:recombinase family protein n=1 Tax=Methylocystis silviterrae TaxID=2743612 RepID=UPI001AED51CE|nr:recombinase family protein [Methylocystis silviterrae]
MDIWFWIAARNGKALDAPYQESRSRFRSLADAWADATMPHGRLMLTVLGGLPEFERELTSARTSGARSCANMLKFIVDPEPKVLCIKGKWGTGKTHAWDDTVKQAASNVAKAKSWVMCWG